MKKLLILTVLAAALVCLAMPIANAQENPYPEFIQQCLDSCKGQPIAWGTAEYKGLEGSDTWFCFQNTDGYVRIFVDNIVPSEIRQNLQAIKADAKKTGWKTEIDAKQRRTYIGTASYDYLCDEDVCTNKIVMKAIQDKIKKTDLILKVTEYFD